MTAKKTKPTPRENQPHILPHGLKRDIVGILLIASSFFVLAANLSSHTGVIGLFIIKSLLKSLTGLGTYLLPFLLGALGILAILRRDPRQFKPQCWGILLSFTTILLIAQTIAPHYFNSQIGPTTGGGGFFGFLLRGIIENTLGRIGLYLAIICLAIISTLLLSNANLASAYTFLKNRLRILINIRIPIKQKKDDPKPSTPSETETTLTMEEPTPSHTALPVPRPAGTTEVSRPSRKSAKSFRSALSLLKASSGYQLPPLSLLHTPSEKEKFTAQKLQESTIFRKRLLEEALKSFGVSATVVGVSTGPSVTRYEVQPDPGVKVSKIANLADDIALNLAAHGVRIEAPIPGRSCVGIEVPNATVSTVYFSELVKLNEFQQNPSKLLVALGKDVAGTPIYGDLTKMPHLLIAGTTGSGKSVCLNSLIASILMRATPQEVKFIMIDPKMVELTSYEKIPHLLAPVVTDVKKAALTLKEWVLPEMERRYRDFNTIGVRNIQSYNAKIEEYAQTGKSWEEEFGFAPDYIPKPRPYIVVVVDELADLMMVASNEVEGAICRLAQMARATGIHLVIATQRPSVDVITGLIKANIPSRISFAVATQVDSRTILDSVGAEKLVGRGDMLYAPIGAMKSIRAQGCFVTDEEINHIAGFVAEQGKPEFDEEILTLKAHMPTGETETSENGKDSLFEEAVSIIRETQQASASFLQRRLRIGYNRAARLMDEIEAAGIVSAPEGEGKNRRILKAI